MTAPRLSVIVITRNERRHIGDCLRSVSFADEWIVVDAGSSDGTREIASGLGARVVETADWPGFGVQKNRALDLTTGDFVFSIDADERVSEALASQIAHTVANGLQSGRAAWRVSRLSSFCGQTMHHGDWYPDHVVRLFRRGAARFSADLVHERLVVDGPIGQLDGELLHESIPSLANALDRMNSYTSGRARDKLRQGARGGLGRAIAHGGWAFVRGYLLKRGFLDGRLGLVLALHVAETTYYRYLKMWLDAQPSAEEPWRQNGIN